MGERILFQLLKNSLYVFLGACCFGILSTVVKLAYSKGFVFEEVMISQFGTGWMILLVLMLFFARRKVSLKQFVRLAGVGLCTCLTGVFYYQSLQSIPASIAVVLLFQFTWMGVIIEAIVNRSMPDKSKLVSIVILFIGTILAGGLIGADHLQLNLKGTLLGLAAALMMALFVFFSGRVETHMPSITRSFYMSCGGLILLTILFTPKVFLEVSPAGGLWVYGLILGTFGVVLPVLLFAMGAPKISTGLATILGAGELPVAVIVSVLFLNELVTGLQWIGVLVILLGIAYPQIATVRAKTAQKI
ncbi:DMT family transporter [Paenibacillus sp. N3/727]|uniref:EamA family transporter n=1 Tax=Paenibacillus sp. N3/727 TaxID=2925845 RepID=UPI001F52F81D|nr:DMT family transporter [Paenibacillus sp. N3/727]UNK16445.1 DMT family transporter [Paenibacillus sp. N3/727]